ncbi:MAG: hypothetical protein ABR596_06980 [Halarsenatibacteraceae bacterium]
MEGLLSLLLFVFFFIIFITRIIKFILRVFKGLEKRSEDISSSEKSTGSDSSSRSKKKPETSGSGSISRKGPPPGFELDLSEIDDKFGEKKEKQRKKPEVLESDTVQEYKARQKEKDKEDINDKKKTSRSKSKRKSMIESGEIGSSGERSNDLSFDNKSLVTGIMMKEILSPPRSLKPYKPVYKDKE